MAYDSEISLTLLTWNVNRSFPSGVSQKDSSKRRDIIISGVLKHFDKQRPRPDVVLIQESTIQEDTARRRWGLSAKYRQQLERKGLYQGSDVTRDVKDMKMKSLSDQIDSLVPEGATDHGDALKQADREEGFADDIIVPDLKDRKLMRSDIPPRAFARKLEVTQNGTKATVIVVSFHSIYKGNRRRYIYLFFNLMCRLAHVHQCPVLIGGDFNLPVGDWRRDTERRFGSRVRVAAIYASTPRRSPKNIIDTFAVVHPQGGRVTYTLSKPVAVYPFPDDVSDGSDHFVQFSRNNKKEIERLLPKTRQGTTKWSILQYDLDHDPVYVTATLQYDPTLFRDTRHLQLDCHVPRDTTVVQFYYRHPMLFRLPQFEYRDLTLFRATTLQFDYHDSCYLDFYSSHSEIAHNSLNLVPMNPVLTSPIPMNPRDTRIVQFYYRHPMLFGLPQFECCDPTLFRATTLQFDPHYLDFYSSYTYLEVAHNSCYSSIASASLAAPRLHPLVIMHTQYNVK